MSPAKHLEKEALAVEETIRVEAQTCGSVSAEMKNKKARKRERGSKRARKREDRRARERESKRERERRPLIVERTHGRKDMSTVAKAPPRQQPRENQGRSLRHPERCAT